jgi:hypothetical protein
MLPTPVNRRFIILVPSEFKDLCEHRVFDVPHVIVKERERGDFSVHLDRKCPCDCNGRYEDFFIREGEIDQWIETQTRADGPNMYKIIDRFYRPRPNLRRVRLADHLRE